MKKLLAFVFCGLLWAVPALSDTTSPHYALVSPSIGNTTNWGLSLNSNFSTIDTNLWEASNGTTIGVNTPSSSSSDIVLTNPIDRVQQLSFTTTGLAVQLPVMNAVASPVVGGSFQIKNTGTPSFEILAADGSTVIVSSLGAGQQVSLTPLSDSTTNGTFSIGGPYLTNAPSGVTFGTTTTGANPSVSGDATTGFYTPSAGNIAATISGTETWLINSTGESVTGNIATTKALDFTSTSAAQTGVTGVYSPSANSLAIMTTGIQALAVTSTQSVGIGTSAPDQLLTVAGAIHSTTTGIEFPDGSFQTTSAIGQVTTGTSNQIAYYPSTAASVAGTNALPNGTTATTQTGTDNTTKVATDAFVQTAVAAALPNAFAVGSYILACPTSGGTSCTNGIFFTAGSTISAVNLIPSTSTGAPTSDVITGTWRAMESNTPATTSVPFLFLRIS